MPPNLPLSFINIVPVLMQPVNQTPSVSLSIDNRPRIPPVPRIPESQIIFPVFLHFSIYNVPRLDSLNPRVKPQ